MSVGEILPSWRATPTREAIISFLDAAEALPIDERVAAFDNDGTLWAERPIVQFDFFAAELAKAAASNPSLRSRPEFAAVLSDDSHAMLDIGLEHLALALAELFEGLAPTEFVKCVREYMKEARNLALDLPTLQTVYQPMLELLDELRRREFTVFIVSGGGTEFVRAISGSLYGVPPENVVGTLIAYEFSRDSRDRPVLRRTAKIESSANEGAAKVSHIQTQLGRRPIFAAGNSGGDREMLEWACASDGPSLALLVDHDDAVREFSYVSTAATFAEAEAITAVGARLGWTIVSMANDWATIFPDSDVSEAKISRSI